MNIKIEERIRSDILIVLIVDLALSIFVIGCLLYVFSEKDKTIRNLKEENRKLKNGR